MWPPFALFFVAYKPWHNKPQIIVRRLARTNLYLEGMKDRFKIVSIKLAATIRRRRKELGYSQEKFALQVGVDRTYMSKIERSIGNPSLEKLVLIAGALNCTLKELFEEA